jgi:hypothetical protein
MRTFSLIWSGIGCFATVAITVLGGVILANTNSYRTRADSGGPYLDIRLVLNGEYLSYFGGMRSLHGISTYPGYSGIYFTSGSQPFTVKLTLDSGYKFTGKEVFWWGSFNTNYEDDNHIVNITTVGSGIDYSEGGFTINGPETMHYGIVHCIHLYLEEVDEVTVTSHISLET